MLLDRLRDIRHPLLVLFVAGTALVVLARFLVPGLPGALVAAVIAIAAIAALAFVHWRRKHPDLRLAGDEAYYLGLLFTLASLIVALLQMFVFRTDDDPLQQRTQELIGNFGVALVSTVAGILARVLLQSEAEPDDGTALGPEGSDISANVLALRREIRDATDALAHFRRMAIRSAQEAKTHTETLARTFNEDMVRTMRNELQTGGTAWHELAEQMARDQRRLAQVSEHTLAAYREHLDNTATSKIDEAAEAWRTVGMALVGQANDLSQRLEAGASSATDRVAASWSDVLKSIQTAADISRDRLRTDMVEISSTLASLKSVEDGFDNVAKAVAHTTQRLESLSLHADKATVGLDARASEIVAAHEALLRNVATLRASALKELNDSADASQRRIGEDADRWQQAVRKLATDGEAQLGTAAANLDAAEQLNEQLHDHAVRWSTAADETNKALVNVVDELTDIVRKS